MLRHLTLSFHLFSCLCFPFFFSLPSSFSFFPSLSLLSYFPFLFFLYICFHPYEHITWMLFTTKYEIAVCYLVFSSFLLLSLFFFSIRCPIHAVHVSLSVPVFVPCWSFDLLISLGRLPGRKDCCQVRNCCNYIRGKSFLLVGGVP